MLRPIHRVRCWKGLQAGFDLQVNLVLWLCEPATKPIGVSKSALSAVHPDEGVQTWLWNFLLPRPNHERLPKAARQLAGQSNTAKARLQVWIKEVRDANRQFKHRHAAWPAPLKGLPKWNAFKELNEAFYERLKSVGVPFSTSGKPSKTRRIFYKDFVEQFRKLNGLEVCVFCGGPLGNPKVDHWVSKAKYPLLSIAPHNLTPICHRCNEPPCKGTKDVFQAGAANAFGDWFHPYFRSGFGAYSLIHDWPLTRVEGAATDSTKNLHLQNLQSLLELPNRWTEEFQLKYDSLRRTLRKKVREGELQVTTVALHAKIAEWHGELDEHRPHYAVHELLLRQAQQPDRLSAWLLDLQEI